ncbi:MAG: Gx transporter family protein [Eubacteriales bacterium]|nr:Gx transporter family protein [Eubacteriales bacterium]
MKEHTQNFSNTPPSNRVQRTVYAAILLALALVLAYLENLIPPPLPFLPLRWGFSNIAVMYALYTLGSPSAYGICLLKAALNALSRGPLSALLSLAGGLASISIMSLLLRSRRSLFFISVFGALSHNLAQILICLFILPKGSFIYLLIPILLLSIATGLISAFLLNLSLKSTQSKVLALLLLPLLTLSACHKAELSISKTYYDVFDTVVELRIDAHPDAEKLIEAAHDKLKQMHKLFDRFHSYKGVNNLYTLNQMAGEEAVELDPLLFNLIQESLKYAKASHLAFNPSIGAVTAKWQAFLLGGSDHFPEPEELTNLTSLADIEAIELDASKQTVFIKNKGMAIDLGAIAKGYACEILASDFRAAGVDSALINLGGNVKILGKRNDGQTFRIGINNPYYKLALSCESNSEEAERLSLIDKRYAALIPGAKSKTTEAPSEDNSDLAIAQILSLENRSAVTSGIYERFRFHAGKRYHHLIDPSTGYPSDRYDAITIIAENSTLADAYSTALFNLSIEDGKALLADCDPTAAAIWYLKDGSLAESNHFSDYQAK